jgi:hypothetical protein
MSLFPATSFLARAAVTRTRRFALSPLKPQLSSVPVARCDSAMARTLHPLPIADEAGSRVFAEPSLQIGIRSRRLMM